MRSITKNEIREELNISLLAYTPVSVLAYQILKKNI